MKLISFPHYDVVSLMEVSGYCPGAIVPLITTNAWYLCRIIQIIIVAARSDHLFV